MKIRYRILILAALFAGALVYFFQSVPEHLYMVEQGAVVPAGKSILPIVSFEVDGVEVNETLAYSFQPDEHLVRQHVLPVGPSREFGIRIDERASDIRRLVCQILKPDSLEVVEEVQLMALKEQEDGRLAVQIMLQQNYENDREYLARITLTTSEGRSLYYYTNAVMTKDSNIAQRLAFATLFHESVLDYDKKYDMEQYLETEQGSKAGDFASVTLSDSIDVVGYGELAPVELYREIPMVTEYNGTYLSLSLEYHIAAFSNDGKEQYRCREAFRYQVGSKKTVLYDYHREMEAEFDGSIISEAKNQIKVGLTNDTTLSYLLSENGSYLLFERDKVLWQLDRNTGKLVEVFGYRGDKQEFYGYDSDAHEFRLISADNEGNACFVVCGYIPRGEYEGRVGAICYRYYKEDNRLEELMFLPTNLPYGVFREDFGAFLYMNSYDELYFTLADTLYLYRTKLQEFSTVATQLSPHWFYYASGKMLVMQELPADGPEQIVFYDLENGTEEAMQAADGELLLLLGTIDQRMVYGRARREDRTVMADGSGCFPMYQLYIQELDGTIVRSYEKEGLHILSAEVDGNVISLDLGRRVEGEGRARYENVSDDIILNIKEVKAEAVTLVTRTTDLMHREYYIALPSTFSIRNVPQIETTLFTVLGKNTAVRAEQAATERYLVTAFGTIVSVEDTLGDALQKADEVHGTVLFSDGTVWWRRGVRATRCRLNGIRMVSAKNAGSEAAVLSMLLAARGGQKDAETLWQDGKTFFEILQEETGGKGISITGTTIDQVLSFVSEGRPVAAVYKNQMILITGYSPSEVIYMDPVRGKTITVEKEKLEEIVHQNPQFYTYYR